MRQKRKSVWKFKRPDRESWYIRFFDQTGKLRTESTETDDEDAAESIRSDKESDLNNGRYRAPDGMGWGDFRDAYETEALPSLAPNSRSKRQQIFDQFEEAIAPKHMKDITTRAVSRYAALRQSKGRKPSTVKADLAHLRSAFQWAKGQGMLTELPKFPVVKLSKGSNKVRVRGAARITLEEFERLLMKAPSEAWRTILAFAWHCGMRRHEALNVCGEHVRLDEHVIEIPSNKAGDEAATVFITPELDKVLRERWPDGKLPKGRLAPLDEFPGDIRQLSKRFAVIAKRATVKGSGKAGFCTMHDLRRNFGSRWAAKVPAQVLQRMMRHSHISTTMDYYADVEQAALSLLWPEKKTEGVPASVPQAAKARVADQEQSTEAETNVNLATNSER